MIQPSQAVQMFIQNLIQQVLVHPLTKTISGTQSFDQASSNWSSAAITKITVRGLNEGARISKVIYDGKILNASTTPPNLPSINSVMKASTEAGFSYLLTREQVLQDCWAWLKYCA